MPKLHVGEEIPNEIAARIRTAAAAEPDETLLAVYDETTFGSGKAGFALTAARFIQFDGERADSVPVDDIVRFQLAQLEIHRHQLEIERRVGDPIRELVYLSPAEREQLAKAIEGPLPEHFAVLDYEDAHNQSTWRQHVYRGSGGMTLTTSPSVEGRRISGYLGIVTGEAVMGADYVSDIEAAVANVSGGRASMYEAEMCRGREIAMRVMEDAARRSGANCIVGIHVDLETPGQMLVFSCTGTAVTIE